MEEQRKIEQTKCLIIGSGPAGYTAAIYAARANLNPVLYMGVQPGGQLTTTTDVENFPGYPEGVSGPQMMEDFRMQAQRFGTEIRMGTVTKVDFSVYPFVLTIDDEKQIKALTVIIATGASAKYLGIESEEKFKGRGVSACATCDGFFYRGKDVAVVGGGDTAAEEASYLAGLCNKVYMIVRKNYLRASQAMQKKLQLKKNITILFNHVTQEIIGNKQGVTAAILLDTKNQKKVKIYISGFFLGIGHKPNSDVFKKYIKTDENGFILTEPGTTRTNVPGVYACGDVQDKVFRQAITAAATGCMAAIEAERFLAQK